MDNKHSPRKAEDTFYNDTLDTPVSPVYSSKMTSEKFEQEMNSLLDDVRQVLSSKGRSYASADDRLSNFKEAATPRTHAFDVWRVYADKHWTAIKSWIDDYVEHGSAHADLNASEPIRGRFIDLIAYALLGYALTQDFTDKTHD